MTEDDADRSHGWQDSSWIFPKALRLLEIPGYRRAVLSGLLISIGSKTDSTVNKSHVRWCVHPSVNTNLCQQRRVRSSLVTYAKKLPVDASNGGSYNLQTLVADLIAEAKSNLSSNTKVIPVLQALNSLLEADALERLCDSEDGIKRRDEVSLPHCKQSDVWRSARALLSISSRGVSRLKSVQRIQECMKACVQCIAHVCMIVTMSIYFSVVNLLALPQISDSCIPRLVDFLTHQYPTVR